MLAKRGALASRLDYYPRGSSSSSSSSIRGRFVVLVIDVIINIARCEELQGVKEERRGRRVDDADRSFAVALGSQDGPTDIEAASDGE